MAAAEAGTASDQGFLYGLGGVEGHTRPCWVCGRPVLSGGWPLMLVICSALVSFTRAVTSAAQSRPQPGAGRLGFLLWAAITSR